MSDKKVLKGILMSYPKPDDGYLKAIFNAQTMFGSKFCDFNRCKWDRDYRIEWTRTFADCIMDELSEVLNWLPWKHWKNYSDFVTDEVELRFELIDILHFVTSLCLVNHIYQIESPSGPISISDRSALEQIFEHSARRVVEPEGRNKALATRIIIRSLNQGVGCLQGITDSLTVDIETVTNELLFDLVTAMGLWGMNPSDIYNYYISKNQENFDRQERGY